MARAQYTLRRDCRRASRRHDSREKLAERAASGWRTIFMARDRSHSRAGGRRSSVPVELTAGRMYRPPGAWMATTHEGWTSSRSAGRLHRRSGTRLRYVRLPRRLPVRLLDRTSGTTRSTAGFGEPTRCTSVQTTPKVIERCMLMTTDPGDLVLDPTCGIGTTAYVAEQWGRRWITIDTSRVALALARTRLMGARVPVLPHGRHARGPAQGGRAHRRAAASAPPRVTSARASSTSGCRT